MRELQIEGYLVELVKALGGVCLKLTPVGDNGWPDRLVLLPGGVVGFLELKRPGGRPTALQKHRIAVLQGLGFRAGWTDSLEGVAEFLDYLLGR